MIIQLKENILSSFDPITLEQMDDVKLLNRVDTKFVINQSNLPNILQGLQNEYYILDIDGVRMYPYHTTYFDTEDLLAYRNHHNGKLNRYKVRLRTYLISEQNYFEIKFKNNKKRTIKSRVNVPSDALIIDGKSEELLLKKSPFKAADLQPKLSVKFSRTTLVSKKMNERITLDTGISFTKEQIRKEYNGLMIIEVKQGKSEESPIIKRLHNMHLSPARLSKYCLGVISMYDGIKYNLFKETLLNINRILS
jgi:hypothetical protein